MILCCMHSSFLVPTNSNSIISSKDFQYCFSKRSRNFSVILLSEPRKETELCLSLVKPVNIVHPGAMMDRKGKILWIMLKVIISSSGYDVELLFEKKYIWFLIMVKGYKVITQEDLERGLLSVLCFLLRFSPQFTPHLSPLKATISSLSFSINLLLNYEFMVWEREKIILT